LQQSQTPGQINAVTVKRKCKPFEIAEPLVVALQPICRSIRLQVALVLPLLAMAICDRLLFRPSEKMKTPSERPMNK
jgi:hypothetical protein